MRIDFYILSSADPAARAVFCCRLAEKAYREGHRVYVRTGGREETAALDQRLWTFRAGSFVPHATADEAEDEPVVLGDGLPQAAFDVLVNLAADIPRSWRSHDRIVEIADQTPDILRTARAHYREYRDAGVEPAYHRL